MTDGGAGARSRSDPTEPLDEREPLSGWPPRDFLAPFVLLAVSMQRAHGYVIEDYLRAFGLFGITMSTLYRTLRQMEKDGFLESTWEPGPTGPARRVYSITDAGHDWLESSAALLDTYRQTIDRFLDLYGAGPGANRPDSRREDRQEGDTRQEDGQEGDGSEGDAPMTKTQETSQDTDVFGVWRELYDANEKAWTAALEQAMGTSEFGKSSGRLLETMLAAQKSVRDNMRAYLETMNVPTREDIARLGELVVGLEEKSDQIADRLDALDDVIRTQSAEAGKIDQIGGRLDTIDRSLRSQATQVAKIDRIAKRLDTIDRALRSQAKQGAKIDRIAKRLDTIDRAVRSRTVVAGKPAARTARPVAAKPATAAAMTAKPARPAKLAAAKPATSPTSASNEHDSGAQHPGCGQPLVLGRSRARDGARRPRLHGRAGRHHAEGGGLAQEQGTPVSLRSVRAGDQPNADLPRAAAHQPCLHPGPAAGGEFVEFLLDEGFDVFLVDWGIPGDEDRALDVTTLVTRYLPRAAKAIQRTTGADQMTVLGYCIGGALATCFSALHPEVVRNLVLLTAPLDFAEAGRFGRMTARGVFPIDLLTETYPTIPGQMPDVGRSS